MLPSFYQQQIEETFYRLRKLQPAELAPVLAARYTRLSFAVARQELQELADTLSRLSVAVNSFVLDTDWKKEETAAAEETRRRNDACTGSALLTVAEAAKRLSLTKVKLYRMIESGQVPAVDINAGSGKKRLLRIRVLDLLSCMTPCE